MARHTASEVAKWFLAYNRMAEYDRGAERISNLKLQKLLYYAQGTFLAVNDEPLFDDPIVAWAHGPVVENVYHEYKANHADGIVFEDDFDGSSFTDDENRLLEEVYNVFGQYSAWKLRNMTHEETPWCSTRANAVIPLDVIRDYFKLEYVE